MEDGTEYRIEKYQECFKIVEYKTVRTELGAVALKVNSMFVPGSKKDLAEFLKKRHGKQRLEILEN
ncbi:hypothetical protein HC928_02880 [bacterium]|nr:hypothetical protein [bacterium]